MQTLTADGFGIEWGLEITDTAAIAAYVRVAIANDGIRTELDLQAMSDRGGIC